MKKILYFCVYLRVICHFETVRCESAAKLPEKYFRDCFYFKNLLYFCRSNYHKLIVVSIWQSNILNRYILVIIRQ